METDLKIGGVGVLLIGICFADCICTTRPPVAQILQPLAYIQLHALRHGLQDITCTYAMPLKFKSNQMPLNWCYIL